MDGFKTIDRQLKTGKLKLGQVEEMRMLFQSALEDGRISTKELTQIQFFYYDSDLSEKDFSTLKDGVFKNMVERAITDHNVTEQEYRGIFRVAKQLNISPESTAWAQEQMRQFSLPHEKAAGEE